MNIIHRGRSTQNRLTFQIVRRNRDVASPQKPCPFSRVGHARGNASQSWKICAAAATAGELVVLDVDDVELAAAAATPSLETD